jgi:polyisoprenoid-binding protein YceI
MKNIFLSLTASVFIFTTFAFTTLKKEIDVAASNITWTGKKITGAHTGNIKLKQGYFNFTEDGKLTGGEFIMDMTSIEVTDLDGEHKTKLEGHLNSEDFFGVAAHPTSKLLITKVKMKSKNSYEVHGDLSIKGNTRPVTFEMQLKDNRATAQLAIDRTKYGIRYGSGSFFSNLGDNTIHDNFTLDVNLKY